MHFLASDLSPEKETRNKSHLIFNIVMFLVQIELLMENKLIVWLQSYSEKY